MCYYQPQPNTVADMNFMLFGNFVQPALVKSDVDFTDSFKMGIIMLGC